MPFTDVINLLAILNSVSCPARFLGKILPEAKRRRGDFFQNLYNLAGQWGHGITFANKLIMSVKAKCWLFLLIVVRQ